jgi:hypothetical protein
VKGNKKMNNDPKDNAVDITKLYTYEKSHNIPYKCPICGGCGNVTGGFYSGCGQYRTSSVAMETCRSCCGTGIIWGK